MAKPFRTWVLAAQNGQEVGSSRMFSTSEVNAYRGAPSCFTFINEITNKVKNVGACRRGGLRDGTPGAAPAAPSAAAPAPNKPAAAAVAGWWPFSKKTKKLPRDPRRMAQTVMYIPSPSGRVNQVMRGAKRRRR